MPTEPNERGPLIETPFVHDEIDWVDPYHDPRAGIVFLEVFWSQPREHSLLPVFSKLSQSPW